MCNEYVFNNGKFNLRVSAYGEGIVRITYGISGKISSKPDRESLIVTGKKQDIKSAYRENAYYHIVETNFIKVIIEKNSLKVTFERDNGQKISSVTCPSMEEYDIYREVGGDMKLRKTVDGIKTSVSGGEKQFVRSSYHAALQFDIGDEVLFGLGSHEEGYPCINGHFVPLYQENMRISVPCFVSSRNYAYLIDNASYMTFDCRKEDHAQLYIDSADIVDYYFICGNDFDEVCARYRYLTGETPMFPKWAVGYAQSKERYENQDELIAVVEEYRRREVPLDLIIQDWQYWKDDCWGDKSLDESRYPDMSAATDAIHRMGAHLMISIWPNMSGGCDNQQEFVDSGMMLGDGSVYDAFDEKARELYWKQANEGLFKYGIDAWWCDSSEPYDAVWQGEERAPLEERMQLSVSEFKKYLDEGVINAYSLKHSQGIYENQRRENPAKRVVNLTRSGYPGQHRYATIAWSGDVSANWDTLKRQVHIAQNYIACGEAYWNSDIGGFFVKSKNQWFWKGEYEDGCRDPKYRELYTRWLQFAAFTPFMRSHGTDTPREIWQFGERGTIFYDAIEAAIRLRYSLVPYFYSINANVTFDGKMPIRPLALTFPDDKNAHKVFGEYMYGNEFLVCPVTDSGCEEVDVYLPEGLWYDYYNERPYNGGQTMTIKTDIQHIPVFVRGGAIIPTVQVMQYTGEVPDAPYEIRVYAGADGAFMLYDDAGDGYEYEQGEYSRINIIYNDSTKAISEEQFGKDKYAHERKYRVIGVENSDKNE